MVSVTVFKAFVVEAAAGLLRGSSGVRGGRRGVRDLGGFFGRPRSVHWHVHLAEAVFRVWFYNVASVCAVGPRENAEEGSYPFLVVMDFFPLPGNRRAEQFQFALSDSFRFDSRAARRLSDAPFLHSFCEVKIIR